MTLKWKRQVAHKRTTPKDDHSPQKKSKGAITTMSLLQQPVSYEFWYGFTNLETLAYEAGMPPIIIKATLLELTAQGYNPQEAMNSPKVECHFHEFHKSSGQQRDRTTL